MAAEDGPPGDALTPRQFAEWARRNMEAEQAAKAGAGAVDAQGAEPGESGAPAQKTPGSQPPAPRRGESLHTRLTRERFDEALSLWNADDALKQFLLELFDDAPRWNFFALLRAIQALSPDKPRIGDANSPKKESFRLGQFPSLAFARVAIQGVQPAHGRRPPRIVCNHFGLLGPNGPMPLDFSEYVRSRSAARDRTLEAFLDIFHHRMMSLLFKAWAIAQPPVEFDRASEDRMAGYIGSLIGLGTGSTAGRDSIPDLAKLHYAGRLAGHTKNAEGLEAIIGDFFKVRCRLVQFVGQWLDLPTEDRCILGASRATGTLNGSCVVGSKVWDVTQRFRLVLGPMGIDAYERFLPGGRSFPRMVDWVKNYCGWEFRWDAQLILAKDDIPTLRLGSGARLGWTTWLRTRPLDKDADHLVLRPESLESGLSKGAVAAGAVS